MSSGKFTPGPWVHHADDNIITTGDGRLLLEWQARSNHRLSGQMSVEERDANARLIAAAPELLAACQLLIADYEDPNSAIGDDWYRKAKAAISKATGSTS